MDTKRMKIEAPAASAAATAQKGECPVCFQVPRAQIFQCSNGHSLCDFCSKKLTTCPTCRSRGVRVRNLLAESLLDDVLFKCTWNRRGCVKVMLRGQLTAHEDDCDYNPLIIKLCPLFYTSKVDKTCISRVTSVWLSKSENGDKFICHIKACRKYSCLDNFQFGKSSTSALDWNFLKQLTITPLTPPQNLFQPKFYRFPNSSNRKDQFFFRTNLLTVDSSGNKALSWVVVQLTPEVNPVVVKITINGNAKSNLMSEWGQNSVSALSWIIKPIGFNEFKNMIGIPESTEKGLSFPFSVPTSFLQEYYVNDDGKLIDTMIFQSTA